MRFVRTCDAFNVPVPADGAAAESALVSVVATEYLLGVWMRRVEKLVEW